MKPSAIEDYDLYLFHQGTNFHAYRLLGAHPLKEEGRDGVRFAVWAPDAVEVSVVGDFNGWNPSANPLARQSDGEIWVGFVDGLEREAIYKYSIRPQGAGPNDRLLKADPYALYAEVPPNTASRVYDFDRYQWQDAEWQRKKGEVPSYGRPMLTYEVHLGSWRRTPQGETLSYRDLAEQLIDYCVEMHYTHLELMPLAEHPFGGSWGYQGTGYFAATSRYGRPEDLMYLVDRAHQNGIAVIMDWVPGHFCKDAHGLYHFDGRNLYESDNELRAENREWGTVNFDYGRTEVISFLISSAMFWLEEFHMDGLRIDAVGNMLYLNYGRREGEWQPNKYGENGNLEAIEFLHKLNEAVFRFHPGALMIAEEATDWPKMSRPIYLGGMGFNYKWNMGWMNDMLRYMALDPVYKKWHHDKLTFSIMYAFNENYVLPLSHDEVVHGKKSLLDKMPGDYWQKFANLRAFYGYWMAHPGKKLLFMGGEFGQVIEWKYDDSLDWHLTERYPKHEEMMRYSKALNEFYVENKAFWEIDCDYEGFEWIDCNDAERSIIAFQRRAEDRDDFVIAVINFTPEVRHGYRLAVPRRGVYKEVFNSDLYCYGGSGVRNEGAFAAEEVPYMGKDYSIQITLPPLSAIYFKKMKEVSPESNSALNDRE